MSGCDSVVTLTLTITPSETATFSYDTTSYCSVSSDPTQPLQEQRIGVFGATPTGLTISASTGAIDLDASTAGTYTVHGTSHQQVLIADTATASITVETCTDTDGDGIPDITDLDDDNDGILDSDECTHNYNGLINGDFEIPVNGGAWKLNVASLVPGWEATASDNKIGFGELVILGIPSQNGNQYMELNASGQATVFQNISLNGHGGEFSWSLYHRARENGVKQVNILIGDSQNSATVEKLITGISMELGLNTLELTQYHLDKQIYICP